MIEPSKYKFGMEIEMSLPVTRADWEKECEFFRREYFVDAYLDCRDQHDVDQGYDLHVTYDGSVEPNDGERGWEIITRPMTLGDTNFVHSLKRIMLYLYRKGGKTDISCGLHVHFDAKPLNGTNLANILMFYAYHQDILYSLCPNSRREGVHSKPFRTQEIQGFEAQLSAPECTFTEGYVLNTYDHRCDRYHIINYVPLDRGHFEIRIGMGTINPRRMFNWVELQLAIICKIANEFPSYNPGLLKNFWITSESPTENPVIGFLRGLNLTTRLKEYYTSEYRRWNS